MIKVVILTGSKWGFASYVLLELLKSNKLEILSVVFNEGSLPIKSKSLQRRLKKIMKIGLLGGLNGIRIRRWYKTDVTAKMDLKNLETICIDNSIPFEVTPAINCSNTIHYFNKGRFDVGLSLGNGYISSKVFTIPRYGMINVHHEELPAFQNAQSVIWQLYNKSKLTAYTIHSVNKKIDRGDILSQEKIPISFQNTLRRTVTTTYINLIKSSTVGLVNVLEDFENHLSKAVPQKKGNTYTTPSIYQFIRIILLHKKLRNQLKSS